MPNEVVIVEQNLPVAALKQRVMAVKSLIKDVFEENVHFGKIPGAGEKKTLFKPGAEQICAMFRVTVKYRTEDLSGPNESRYRVVCEGWSHDGVLLGEGMGECSTAEEKYRWRKAVCDEEFEETPETQRRVVYKRAGQGHYKAKQIMTNAADSANTVLKMACKRAQIAMTLTVSGCSDIFSQDLEDTEPPPPDEPPEDRTPKSKAAAPAGKSSRGKDAASMEGEKRWITNRVQESGANLTELLQKAGIASLNELDKASFDIIRQELV